MIGVSESGYSNDILSFQWLQHWVLLGVLLWGKWGLFEPQGIQVLKSSTV